jgi:DNA-directed RNA polymerase subunit RPC12/RpoP
MIYHCAQCGSERIHKSRFRPGERTASNLFLAPYRCRDCKARFWGRNNDAYVVATISIGSILLFGTLVWLAFAPDGVTLGNQSFQSQAILTTRPQSDDTPSVLEVPVTSNSILSTAIERGEKIDIQTFKNEEPQSLPDPSDNRFYTVSLFLEKAKKGNADAQYQLGLLYLTGRGTLQDFSEAAKWLILAAEQNHPLAQYELGLLYQVGQGVDLDNEKSYMWFNLAAAAGVEQALLARDKAMRSLNKEQLASAQKAAREWLNSKNKSR